MDAIGHINNATYLTYFETARVDFLKQLGFDLLKRLTEQVVEHAKVEVHPKSEGRQIMMILVPQVVK